MAGTIISASRIRLAMGLVSPAAGVLFGLLSVYSNTRVACGLWVVVALVAAFISGLLLYPLLSMNTAKAVVLKTADRAPAG